jgi:hypothetical protein
VAQQFSLRPSCSTRPSNFRCGPAVQRDPAGPHRCRQPTPPPSSPAADDRWGPPVIPDLPCPSRARLSPAPPPVSDPGTRRYLARTPRRPSFGLFKAACTPWTSPICALAARAPCAAARRRVPSSSSQSHRREAVQGLRHEVRNPHTSLVAVPTHRSTRKPSPKFPSRTAASSARSAASPPLPPPLVASPFRAPRPRLKSCSGALDRVRRLAPPPLAAGRRRRTTPSATQLHACVLYRRIQIRRA